MKKELMKNVPTTRLSSDEEIETLLSNLRNEETEEEKDTEKEKKVIPEGIVSSDEEIETLLSDLRNEETEEEEDIEKEKKVIPEGIVSVSKKELEKIHEALLKHEKMYTNDDGSFGFLNENENIEKPKEKELIPEGIVSSDEVQWYINDKERFLAEVKAMRNEMNDPNLMPKFLKDGRMYFEIDIPVKIGDLPKKVYKFLLLYETNHPYSASGTSVKAYPIKPSISDMIEMLNENDDILDKSLPHTLPDSHGNRYLCSINADNTSEITSGVTSKRRVYYWLVLFETGLLDPKIMSDFQGHGKL